MSASDRVCSSVRVGSPLQFKKSGRSSSSISKDRAALLALQDVSDPEFSLSDIAAREVTEQFSPFSLAFSFTPYPTGGAGTGLNYGTVFRRQAFIEMTVIFTM